MYIRLFLFSLILFSLELNAQIKLSKPANFVFIICNEVRVNPIYLKDNGYTSAQNDELPFYNEQKQLTGISYGMGIEKNIRRLKASIAINAYTRYDHIYFEDANFNNSGFRKFQIGKSLNSFNTDYNILFTKYLFNEHLSIGFGYSKMNRGTDFSYSVKEATGQPYPFDTLIYTTTGDFEYDAYPVELGYWNKKFGFKLGAYISSREASKTFLPKNFIMPYLKFIYRINL
jgi:hypothetical protein